MASRQLCDVQMALLYILKNSPGDIQWKRAKTVSVLVNNNKSLGITINTFKGVPDETYTVITSLQTNYQGYKLSVGDRILKIANEHVEKWKLEAVHKLIEQQKDSGTTSILFKISPLNLKWFKKYCKTFSPPRGIPRTGSAPTSCAHPSRSLSSPTSVSCQSSSASDMLGRWRQQTGGFDGLHEIDDSQREERERELADEAFEHPWNIKWCTAIRKVTIERKPGYSGIGLQYVFKQQPHSACNDVSSTFCVVECTKAGGPSEDVLHRGDLIHSVNGQPINKKNTLKDAVAKGRENIIVLMIQRPQSLLTGSHTRTSLPPPVGASSEPLPVVAGLQSLPSSPTINGNALGPSSPSRMGLSAITPYSLISEDIQINGLETPRSTESSAVFHDNSLYSIGPSSPATNGSSVNKGNIFTRLLSKTSTKGSSASKEPVQVKEALASVDNTKSRTTRSGVSIGSETSATRTDNSTTKTPTKSPTFFTKADAMLVKPKAGAAYTDDFLSSVGSKAHRKDEAEAETKKRLNLSDTSVAVSNRKVSTPFEQQRKGVVQVERRQGDSLETALRSFRNPSFNSSLEKCLRNWQKRLHRQYSDYVPYIRLINLCTRDKPDVILHEQILKQLNIAEGLRQTDSSFPDIWKGTFALGDKALLKVVDELKLYSIEDIVLARCGAVCLKEMKFVLENRGFVLKELAKRLDQTTHKLMGSFMKEPPHIDDYFVSIESLVIGLQQISMAEYTAELYAEHCLFTLCINFDEFATKEGQRSELGRVRLCLNTLRLVRAHSTVCVVTRPRDALSCDPVVEVEREHAAAHGLSLLAEELETPAPSGGVVTLASNKCTGYPLFNLSLPEHADALRVVITSTMRSGLVGSVHAAQSFAQSGSETILSGGLDRMPLLALVLNKKLRELSKGTALLTQSQLGAELVQLCPQLESTEALVRPLVVSLHTAGQVLMPSMIRPGRQGERLLNAFVVVRPRSLITAMQHLRTKQISSQGGHLPDTGPFSDQALVAFLQHMSCVEASSGVYHYAHALPAVSHVPDPPSLTSPNGAAKSIRLYSLDFAGFLPAPAVTRVICCLATRIDAKLHFRLSMASILETSSLRAEVCLNPFSCSGWVCVQGPRTDDDWDLLNALGEVLPPWLKMTVNGRPQFVTRSTPTRDLPVQLLQRVSCLLHPASSPLGSDVRLLAEHLGVNLLALDVHDRDIGVRLLQNSDQTLEGLLQILHKMQRHDVAIQVTNWLENQ